MKMKFLKIALILSVVLCWIQLPKVEAATYNGETTVNLNIRSLPSTKGRVITTLPRGTKVKYASYNRSWHKVYWNNRTYYASASYIRKTSSSSSSLTAQSVPSTGVTTVNLNIRVSAYRGAAIVTTLKQGTEVKYESHNSSWAKVYLNGKTYYAAKTYISPKSTQSSTKKSGYANREMNLFSVRNQRSTVKKILPVNTPVLSTEYNSSWSVVYIGNQKYYTATAWISNEKTSLETESNITVGYANREMKLFSVRNQRATVLKTLPINTKVKSSIFNSSWSAVYIGDKTYYTPTAWISNEESPIEQPPVVTKPDVTKKEGYTNREVNLFGRTSQNSPKLLLLPTHTSVTYSIYNSSWSKVYIDSKTYFTATAWLTEGKAPLPDVESPKGKVYTNTPRDVLNVRSNASLNSNVLGQLDHGTEVEHYGIVNGFYKFKYNGVDAYISSDFVTTAKPNPSSTTVIVLDAGHGGKDPGALNGSLYEKTIVLDVTKRTEAYLRSKYNYEVRLTRSKDIYLTLNERVESAKTLRGDLFVSFHANSADTTAAKGIETYYSSTSAHSARSRVLASNIQSNLSGKMSGMSNRGVKSAEYYVIRNNTMPAALVELGFISSPTDLTYLQSAASRQRMAEGVAEGIAQYVRTYY